jgi:hypothetical protein
MKLPKCEVGDSNASETPIEDKNFTDEEWLEKGKC